MAKYRKGKQILNDKHLKIINLLREVALIDCFYQVLEN